MMAAILLPRRSSLRTRCMGVITTPRFWKIFM